MAVVPVYKRLGETPLACLTRYRHTAKIPGSVSVTYAGRLDPMAEGLLLLLTGDDVKEKIKYLDLPKTYEARILLGIETDTYDALGLIKSQGRGEVSEDILREAGESFLGSHRWPYPAYSSRVVSGHPLFWWAKEGRLKEIQIPLRTMLIDQVVLNHTEKRSGAEIFQDIIPAIQSVSGDFRQKQILERWTSQMSAHQIFTVSQWTLNVGSGTYVRSFAHELGKKLGTGACLLHLRRTKLGTFDLKSVPVSET